MDGRTDEPYIANTALMHNIAWVKLRMTKQRWRHHVSQWPSRAMQPKISLSTKTSAFQLTQSVCEISSKRLTMYPTIADAILQTCVCHSSLLTSSLTDCCVRVTFDPLLLHVADIIDHRPYRVLQSVADFMVSWVLMWFLGSHKSGEMTSVTSSLRSLCVQKSLPDTPPMTNNNQWSNRSETNIFVTCNC